ncbi:sulfite exporter TauE/SafE family protein [Polynucleobacter brandtiae]|uniref:Probable membrane transporter protein n=1 Tax=Polynucleobacter brandtiae TaxID=1938816 RepID=A0A2M8VZ46_9BURK|nr:sulfite exporter TauE/SafE family protein [Polynucleobacter brandtiae]PJI83130.1 hypothetical protein B0G85_0522 [Polynucleobacter brandtiae]
MLIIFSAYFIFGVSGFGSSIVAVPLLVQLYPLKTVVPMMVIMDICASLYLGRKVSGDANKSELIWLVPFTLVGMGLGIILLIKSPSEPLLLALGIFAAGNGFRILMQKSSLTHTVINRWWALPFGIAGGIFTALFATGGPIYVSYLGMRIGSPKVLRATMAFAIFMLTFLRLVFMLVVDLILTWDVLVLAATMMVPLFLGIAAGTRFHKRLSQTAMKRSVGMILLFSGSMLLLKQLM